MGNIGKIGIPDAIRRTAGLPTAKERYGAGYPRGMAGEQIPVTACIFAVVDVADAHLSDRPYQAA